MTRRSINNGTWFDDAKAQKFEEGRRWDGRNHISMATGSQWDHEALYLTSSGAWVVNRWSQWQGSGEEYEQIDDRAAATWFAANEYADADIPAELRAALAELEAKPGPKLTALDGETREPRAIRFSDGEWSRLGELAKADGLSVSEYVRGRCL